MGKLQRTHSAALKTRIIVTNEEMMILKRVFTLIVIRYSSEYYIILFYANVIISVIFPICVLDFSHACLFYSEVRQYCAYLDTVGLNIFKCRTSLYNFLSDYGVIKIDLISLDYLGQSLHLKTLILVQMYAFHN